MDEQTRIGYVSEQSGVGKITIEAEHGVDGNSLPGEYIQVGSDSPKTLAVVSKTKGQRITAGSIQYKYTCQLIQPGTEQQLVGKPAFIPGDEALKDVFGKSATRKVYLGELGRGSQTPAYINGSAVILGHTVVFGSSGSGKSSLVGLLLEGLLCEALECQIVILDLNSDYIHLCDPLTLEEINGGPNSCAERSGSDISDVQGRLANTQRIVLRPPTLKMERLSASELLEVSREVDLVAETILEDILTRHRKDDRQPTPGSCRDLLNQIVEESGGGAAGAMISIEEFHKGALRLQRALTRLEWPQLWTPESDDAIHSLSGNNELLVVDLGSVTFDARGIVTEKFLAALWDRAQRETRQTLLVIDEAHNLAPAYPEAAWQRRTLEWINRIAGEGRKYGLRLLLSSQRPAKLHASSMDGTTNALVLRLRNRDDVATVARMSADVDPELVETTSTLPNYEALAFGMMTLPMVLRAGRRVSK